MHVKAAEESESTTADAPRQLVLLIHGIRTRAEWQTRIRALFEDGDTTVVELIGYGYFDAFSFWFPFLLRLIPVGMVHRKIRDSMRLHAGEGRQLLILAHSFGTYAVAHILRDDPDIRPTRLLLCGSIVRERFRWDQLPNRPRGVLNEVGSRDIWPILAKSLSWGYGATGTFGFQAPGIRDRYHDVGHSDYFKGDFPERFWVPWIRHHEYVATPYETAERPPTPLLKSWLAALPLQWMASVVLLCVGILLALRIWPDPIPPVAHAPNWQVSDWTKWYSDEFKMKYAQVAQSENEREIDSWRPVAEHVRQVESEGQDLRVLVARYVHEKSGKMRPHNATVKVTADIVSMKAFEIHDDPVNKQIAVGYLTVNNLADGGRLLDVPELERGDVLWVVLELQWLDGAFPPTGHDVLFNLEEDR